MTRYPDDDDDYYLITLTRTSGADVLVSGDRDLLELELVDVELIFRASSPSGSTRGTAFPAG